MPGYKCIDEKEGFFPVGTGNFTVNDGSIIILFSIFLFIDLEERTNRVRKFHVPLSNRQNFSLSWRKVAIKTVSMR